MKNANDVKIDAVLFNHFLNGLINTTGKQMIETDDIVEYDRLRVKRETLLLVSAAYERIVIGEE